MIRYKVERAFVDYGIYHAVGEIISDVSLINNVTVKLWDGTLTRVEGPDNNPKPLEAPKPTTVPEPTKVTTSDVSKTTVKTTTTKSPKTTPTTTKK